MSRTLFFTDHTTNFKNQQSTPTDSIIAPKGSHIVLKSRVITSNEPAKLFWKGEGVKIEFHDIHGNLVKVVPSCSDVEINAHIMLDNGSFKIYNSILLGEKFLTLI